LKNSINTLVQRKDLLILVVLILVTVAVRLPGVFNRAIWYDEAITLLETAGHATPTWSEQPTPAATQKELLVGAPTFAEIARGLRETDVHPPLYYGILSKWRRLFGGSIEAARLFSVLCSAATVILLYLLLRSSGFAHPFAPSLVYSLSSGAVHYAHETRNYSLTLFFLLSASYLAYLSTISENDNWRKFWMLSISMAVCCGFAFQTNYLSIFPVFCLLLWYIFWIPGKRRLQTIPAVFVTIGISLIGISTLAVQLGARPNQFQKELGIGGELLKIANFNFELLWNPVVSSGGLRAAVIGTVIVLMAVSFLHVKRQWQTIDKKLFTMMVGLAITPSLGVLALDLLFSKNLGKSSYVLFAGPFIVLLLTMAVGNRQQGAPDTSGRSMPRLAYVATIALAFFVGLQLTGVNFDLERTPGFPGSTLRSLAARIEASSSLPVVVIGAGHGRGDPATVVYELDPETSVCVLDRDSDVSKLNAELASFDEVWIVFAKGRMTSGVEALLFEALTSNAGYRVVSRSKRFAHLKKVPQASDRG
jgi:hypothetical protein